MKIEEIKDDTTVENTTAATTAVVAAENSTAIIKNKFVREAVSGVASGTVIAVTSFPFEAYKKYLQSGSKDKFYPYRGLGVFAVNIVPTTLIQIMTDSFLRSYMRPEATVGEKIASSFYCGVQGAMFSTVVENCILKQQLEKKPMLETLQTMVRQSPYRPWKSFSMIATRDGIFTAYMLWGSGVSGDYAKQNLPTWASYATPVAVGILGTALSHPFDMVGAYMQKTDQPLSVMQAAKDVLRERGAMGFFTGFWSRVVMFYTFGTVIPIVNNFANKYLENPVAGKAELKETLTGISNFFFKPKSQPIAAAALEAEQTSKKCVDLTYFRGK